MVMGSTLTSILSQDGRGGGLDSGFRRNDGYAKVSRMGEEVRGEKMDSRLRGNKGWDGERRGGRFANRPYGGCGWWRGVTPHLSLPPSRGKRDREEGLGG